MKTTILIFLLAFSFTTLFAQTPSPQPEAWTNLMKFEGKWEAHGKITFPDHSSEILYNLDFSLTDDGNSLFMKEWSTIPEFGDLIGNNLIGYDPETKEVHWFSTDNAGTAHMHTGNWTSPAILDIAFKGTKGGSLHVETIRFEFTSPEKLDVKLLSMVGGELEYSLEGTFIKTKSASASH